MKKIIFSLSLLSLLALTFSSCKKGSDDELEDCDLTIANLAGRYKIISCVLVSGSTETDVLHSYYEDCELDDINELKTDQTFVYTDGGTVCSPSGTTSGTWNISGQTLILNSGFSVVESFNCRDLVVTFDDGGSTIKETYRKQ